MCSSLIMHFTVMSLTGIVSQARSTHRCPLAAFMACRHRHAAESYSFCLTHASASVAEAKFLARQAAQRLLAFQMQQSEAELNQGNDRC